MHISGVKAKARLIAAVTRGYCIFTTGCISLGGVREAHIEFMELHTLTVANSCSTRSDLVSVTAWFRFRF